MATSKHVLLPSLVSALMMLALAGCGSGTRPTAPASPADEAHPGATEAALTPADGDTLVTTTGPMDTLNFLEAFDTNQMDVVYLLADSLVSFGRDLTIVPRLATHWEISTDHRRVTFHLHPRARFHDGHPLTADDVIFTWKASQDESILWGTYKSVFELVQDIVRIDDHTLQVRYKQPVANPLSSFVDFFILPKHLYDRKDVPVHDNPVNWKPIGSGPYMLEKWEKNVEIVLKANDNYFNGRPHLDRVVFKVIDRNAMTFDMLMNGELDLTPISTMEWQFRTDQESFRKRFQKRKYFVLGFYFVSWNQKNPFFANRLVRQAMAYLCDRKAFNKASFFNQFRIAASPVHPESPFFNPDVRPYPYDPEQGMFLLNQAGIRDRDGDGVLENDRNETFRFRLLVATGDERGRRFAEFYQSSLAEHGIQMEIETVDPARLQEQTKSGDYDACFRGWVTSADPDFLIPMFRTPSGVDTYNDMNYSNPELDHILDLSDRELDPEARKKLFRRAQQIIHEDQPYLFLYYPAALVAVHNRFRALHPSPAGMFRWYPGVMEAFVPKGLQKHAP